MPDQHSTDEVVALIEASRGSPWKVSPPLVRVVGTAKSGDNTLRRGLFATRPQRVRKVNNNNNNNNKVPRKGRAAVRRQGHESLGAGYVLGQGAFDRISWKMQVLSCAA
jgi:hypothetical protein